MKKVNGFYKLTKEEKDIFYNIWDTGEITLLKEFVQPISDITDEEFYYGYQWTNPFHENFEQAIVELEMLINRTY